MWWKTDDNCFLFIIYVIFFCHHLLQFIFAHLRSFNILLPQIRATVWLSGVLCAMGNTPFFLLLLWYIFVGGCVLYSFSSLSTRVLKCLLSAYWIKWRWRLIFFYCSGSSTPYHKRRSFSFFFSYLFILFFLYDV